MDITAVHVSLVEDPKLKAFVTITLDACFVVRDLKVIANSEGGLFVAMPSRKRKNGSFIDIAHPLNTQTRQRLERAILTAYEKTADEKTLSRAG